MVHKKIKTENRELLSKFFEVRNSVANSLWNICLHPQKNKKLVTRNVRGLTFKFLATQKATKKKDSNAAQRSDGLQWTQKNMQGMIIKGQTFSQDIILIIEGANLDFWSHTRNNDTRYSYLEMHTSKWFYRGLELSGHPLENADLGIDIWLKNYIHRPYFRTL